MSDTTLSRLARKTFWGEADARRVVAAWQTSGHSVARFARDHGLDASRVRHWARNFGEDEGRDGSAPTGPALVGPAFYEVVVTGPDCAAAAPGGHDDVRLELPSGAVIHVGGVGGRRLVEVLAAVREVWGC